MSCSVWQSSYPESHSSRYSSPEFSDTSQLALHTQTLSYILPQAHHLSSSFEILHLKTAEKIIGPRKRKELTLPEYWNKIARSISLTTKISIFSHFSITIRLHSLKQHKTFFNWPPLLHNYKHSHPFSDKDSQTAIHRLLYSTIICWVSPCTQLFCLKYIFTNYQGTIPDQQ